MNAHAVNSTAKAAVATLQTVNSDVGNVELSEVVVTNPNGRRNTRTFIKRGTLNRIIVIENNETEQNTPGSRRSRRTSTESAQQGKIH